MKRLAALVRIWVVCLVACAAAVTISFARIDLPMALRFWNLGRHLSVLGEGFGTSVILSMEAAVILMMVITRLVRGHISTFGETLTIACIASMCAYAINDHVLKVFFGVPNPGDVVHGAHHAFNFVMGSANSSFPSGHMVLAGAFSGVFMRRYRASIWPLCALLLLAGALLLVGDWHFLSDIISGTFLGTSAGILAGEAWAAASSRITY